MSAGSDQSSTDKNPMNDYDQNQMQMRKANKIGSKIFANKLEDIIEEPLMGPGNSNSMNQSLFHGHHNPLDSIVSV